jgi:hypothetical protein
LEVSEATLVLFPSGGKPGEAHSVPRARVRAVFRVPAPAGSGIIAVALTPGPGAPVVAWTEPTPSALGTCYAPRLCVARELLQELPGLPMEATPMEDLLACVLGPVVTPVPASGNGARCYMGTADGVLHVLPSGLLFVPKVTYVAFEDVVELQMARSGASGRALDLVAEMAPPPGHKGKKPPRVEFSQIPAELLPLVQDALARAAKAGTGKALAGGVAPAVPKLEVSPAPGVAGIDGGRGGGGGGGGSSGGGGGRGGGERGGGDGGGGSGGGGSNGQVVVGAEDDDDDDDDDDSDFGSDDESGSDNDDDDDDDDDDSDGNEAGGGGGGGGESGQEEDVDDDEEEEGSDDSSDVELVSDVTEVCGGSDVDADNAPQGRRKRVRVE